MKVSGVLTFISLVCVSSALAQPTDGEQPSPAAAATDVSKPGTSLFPVEKVNLALPRWLQFSGEFRTRFESDDGIGYTTTNDSHLLTPVAV